MHNRWIQNRQVRVEWARRQIEDLGRTIEKDKFVWQPKSKKTMKDMDGNFLQFKHRKVQPTRVVGVENEEVKLCLKRCWVYFRKKNLFMKEVTKIMDSLDVFITNIIKCRDHRLILVCE